MHLTLAEWEAERRHILSPRLANQELWDLLWEDLPEIFDKIHELEGELMEEARLNGMGSEREAKLLSKVEMLEKELAQQCAECPEVAKLENRIAAQRVLIDQAEVELKKDTAVIEAAKEFREAYEDDAANEIVYWTDELFEALDGRGETEDD